MDLTRRQQQIIDLLHLGSDRGDEPPTLTELCRMLGLKSRGSMHKHVTALIKAGLVLPMEGKHRGVRLAPQHNGSSLPFLGRIAAGVPIEAMPHKERIEVPQLLRSKGNCYVLEVAGESMQEAGILDGDWVVIEHRTSASNGEIVVALIGGQEVTLKRLGDGPSADTLSLYPENHAMQPMIFARDEVQVQGVVVGQMRRYDA